VRFEESSNEVVAVGATLVVGQERLDGQLWPDFDKDLGIAAPAGTLHGYLELLPRQLHGRVETVVEDLGLDGEHRRRDETL